MGAATFRELRGEVGGLSVEAMVQRLRDNEAKRRMQAADDALLIAALEAATAYRADGHASVYGMLRSMLGWSGVSAGNASASPAW